MGLLLIDGPVLRIQSGIAGVVIDEFPARYSSVILYARRHLDHTRRSEIGPGELFLPRPDQLHRPVDGLRQSRGFDSRFTAMFSAITGTRIGYDHPYLFFVGLERVGELLLDAKRPLCPRPDRQVPTGPFGKRGPRLQRYMRDIIDMIGLRMPEIALGHSRFHITLLAASPSAAFTTAPAISSHILNEII